MGGRGSASKGSGSGGWKPTMTQKEADEWSKNSAIKETIFHGTRSKLKIEQDGFDSTKIGSTTGNAGMLGEGFYFTTTKEQAANYGEVVKVKVNVKNVCGPAEFQKIAVEMGYGNMYGQDPMGAPKKMTKYLKSKGYDAVKYKWSIDEICVFDSKKIVIIKDTKKK